MDPSSSLVIKYVGMTLLLLSSALHEQFPKDLEKFPVSGTSVLPSNLAEIVAELEGKVTLLSSGAAVAQGAHSAHPQPVAPATTVGGPHVSSASSPAPSNAVPAPHGVAAVASPAPAMQPAMRSAGQGVPAQPAPNASPAGHSPTAALLHRRRRRDVGEALSEIAGGAVENAATAAGNTVAGVAGAAGVVARSIAPHVNDDMEPFLESVSNTSDAIIAGVEYGKENLALA